MKSAKVLALALTSLMLLGLVAGRADAARTYISLTFDDGLLSEYQHNDVLSTRDARATFYVNTNKLGVPGFMSWEQVRALADAGNEVGGHTLDHRALPPLDETERQRQVCDDRQALLLRGYDARNFAYPHGQQDAASRATVQGCGYGTARTTGGLDYPSCCVYSERLRPKNAYSVRAFMPRINTPLEIYQDLITRARDGDGGWIALVFHDLCEPGHCENADEFAVDTGTLAALIDWIDAEPQLDIRTTAEVLAIGVDTTPPQVSLDTPAEGLTVLDGSDVTIEGSAGDETRLRSVELLVDGEVVGRDRHAPFRWHWRAPPEEGAHAVQLRATDDAGNSALSATRTITVEHDHVAPAVALTAPQQDATVRDGTELLLRAEASDAVGVTRVDFYAGETLIRSDDEAPYAAAWTAPEQEGPVALSAKAYDARGNEGVSAARTLTVAFDHVAPTVALTAPQDGRELRFGEELLVTADAADDSAVARVDFYAGETLIRADDEAPYGTEWDAPAVAGPVVLTARAYDPRGNEAIAPARTVTVLAPPPDPPDRPDPPDDPPPRTTPEDPPPTTTPEDPPPTPTTPVAPPTTTVPVEPPVEPPHVPTAAPQRRPLPRIVRVRRRADGSVEVRVALANATFARQLRLVVDGRVVRVLRRPKATATLTLKPRPGRHRLRLETLDASGGRQRSVSVTVVVKAR